MSDTVKPVALYHATPVQNVPWILKEGLIPQLGTIAQKQGETRKCVRLYTSAKRAMEAVDEGGDYRKLAQSTWGSQVIIYVFRVFMNPGEAVAFAEVKDKDSVELVCKVPADNLALLTDALEPVPAEEIERLEATYGPNAFGPPETYQPYSRGLPF